MNEPRYQVRTLGCKANSYDSQLLEAELQSRGWKPGENADLCIVNSCTVTDEADRQSRKLAARLARDNPHARVVVTGCAAEVDPERLARSRGIHYVIANRDKPKLVDLILQKLKEPVPPADSDGEVLGVAQGYVELLSRHPMDRDWPVTETFGSSKGAPGGEGLLQSALALEGQGSRTRAFLKIQEGCNSFCTYCIIPYGRGPSRNLEPAQVSQAISHLTAQGIREVVLTGTNLGDYPDFEGLLETVFRDTALARLRVSSLDPVEITPRLLSVMRAEPRFCPHFHVSLQSPHSRVLRLMKRKYSAVEVERCLQAIAELPAPVGGPFVGMDVITGFPGETKAEFEEGLERLRGLPWSRLHVFPYSERAGTPATRLPDKVSESEKSRRARLLNDLSLERLRANYTRVLQSGQALDDVLLERGGAATAPGLKKGEWTSGYTRHYLRVLVRTQGAAARNQLVTVKPRELVVDPARGEVALIADLRS